MKVAVYCRVATRAQCDLPMLHEQRKLGTEKIRSTYGEELAGIFSDIATSSPNEDGYPALTLLRQKCGQGEVKKVYAVTPSCISGSILETLDYIMGLKQLGVSVEFSNGNFQLSMVQFDALVSLIDAFASEEIHHEAIL